MSSLVCSFDLSDLYSFEEFMAHQDDHGWDIDENNPERSWESYLEFESEYLFDDFCDCLGQRILAKDKKVLIEGSNLNWQGASGVATFRAWSDDTLVIGREFVHEFLSGYGDFCAKLYDEENEDFHITVGHSNGRSGFTVSQFIETEEENEEV